MQIAIEQLDIRQIVKRLVVSALPAPRHLGSTQQSPEGVFPLERLKGVPCIGWRLIAELHGVLEHLHEALDQDRQRWDARPR
jgi:hypothetical protein